MLTKEAINRLIPDDFPGNSKVWIYQSSRPFSNQQTIEIKEQLKQFYLQWVVHGRDLKGWADLLFNRFIVMMADESDFEVSGCSVDSAQRVIKSIERQYEAKLFDRLSITFLIKGQPEVLPMSRVQYAVDNGFITGDTLLFNNLVATKAELLNHWLQPFSESWLNQRISIPAR